MRKTLSRGIPPTRSNSALLFNPIQNQTQNHVTIIPQFFLQWQRTWRGPPPNCNPNHNLTLFITLKPVSKMTYTVSSGTLNPIPYLTLKYCDPDYCQNKSFLPSPVCHFSTEFCENRLSSFCIILLTKQTNADDHITSSGGSKNAITPTTIYM